MSQEIGIRLRPRSGDPDPNTFLRFGFIVDIMLHKLTHCTHPLHDDGFNALSSQLHKVLPT